MLITGAVLVFAGGGQSGANSSPYKNRITIDFYSVNANSQGLMAGFTKKMLNEKFNMDINIIAPNVAGKEIFQTRSAAGNLGDYIVVGSADEREVYQAGLVKDITSLFAQRAPNLQKYKNHVDTMNLKNGIPAGKVYYLPVAMSSYSPTEPLPNLDGAMYGLQEGAGAFIRWDAYKAVGAPPINTMEDLLPVLKKMQDYVKVSDSGKPVYGFTLFKDWDGAFMRVATCFGEMYGYLMLPGSSSVFTWVGSDELRTQRLDDEKGMYYRSLKFFYNANKMGLVDPDSPTHTWNAVWDKSVDGQTLLSLWSWTGISAYNQQYKDARGNGNPPRGFEFIPIADADYYAQCYSPSTQWGEAIAIGSKAKDPERIMDFIDWTASPEGMMFSCNGPQGLAWDIKNGKPYVTEYGFKVLDTGGNIDVPAEYGGGTWERSISLFGYGWANPLHHYDINPQSGYPYQMKCWPDVLNTALQKIDQIWRNDMKADDQIDYLKKHNLYTGMVSTTYVKPDDPVNIQTARQTCQMIIRNASWQMAFASSDAEFNSIWNKMKADLNASGWEDLVKADLKIAADTVASRQALLRNLK
jgi:multiple sugar transport system substrate-binding protein/putative aldouronate transport system substrate-binding protein